MSKAMEVTDSTFEAEVLQSPVPVLVDFWASWCAPCRTLAPIIDTVAADMAGKVKIVKLNVDDNQQTAAKYGIRSIPSLLIFKNGAEAERSVGFVSARNLTEKLKTHL
jgi:thioredoxin 1